MNWKISSLFSGVGGIELGMSKHLGNVDLLSEIDPGAISVLQHQFKNADIKHDICTIKSLPQGTDLVTAGFPCQDLSQAGLMKGISGSRSGLINEVFRLVKKGRIKNIVLENVSFMLRLDNGEAMRYITDTLETLGYNWAYRVLDSRSFGVHQRRERVYLFASKEMEPQKHLFQTNFNHVESRIPNGRPCGFYWTEGKSGLGWAVNGLPTLKGGSTIGIPSAPAIWFPSGVIGTPDIRDAERLQGFPENWTKPAEIVGRTTHRWKLVGNAVTVPAAEWVAKSILTAPKSIEYPLSKLIINGKWPNAAFGGKKLGRFEVKVSSWPCSPQYVPFEEFLKYPVTPLSYRAVSGFLSRLETGTLRYPSEFYHALLAHQEKMSAKQMVMI